MEAARGDQEELDQQAHGLVKRQVRFQQPALQAAFLDYVHEVEHAADRLQRLEKAIDDAIATAPAEIQEVVQALQALRGVAKIAAVSIVAELGRLSRFSNPRQLMSYAGLVASEYSSGNRIQRGGITKTGNAHLRRLIVEAAWALPTQTLDWRLPGQAATRAGGRDQSDRLESAMAAVHAL